MIHRHSSKDYQMDSYTSIHTINCIPSTRQVLLYTPQDLELIPLPKLFYISTLRTQHTLSVHIFKVCFLRSHQ